MLGAVIELVAKAVADGLVGRSTSAVLDAVLASKQEQLTALRRIDQNVEDLIRGPFNAGVEYLEHAARPHRSDPERHDALAAARASFVQALGQERRDPARICTIEMHLAMTWLALGNLEDAEEHLERAHETLYSSYEEFARNQGVSAVWSYYNDRGPELMPFFKAVRALRLSLGALPTSVPDFYLVGPSKGAGSLYVIDPPLEDDELVRRLGGGADRDFAYATYGRPPNPLPKAAKYWRHYASNYLAHFVWSIEIPERSSSLSQIAAGTRQPSSKRPFGGQASWRDIPPPGTPPAVNWSGFERWHLDGPDLMRSAARDILIERRANWPMRSTSNNSGQGSPATTSLIDRIRNE